MLLGARFILAAVDLVDLVSIRYQVDCGRSLVYQLLLLLLCSEYVVYSRGCLVIKCGSASSSLQIRVKDDVCLFDLLLLLRSITCVLLATSTTTHSTTGSLQGPDHFLDRLNGVSEGLALATHIYKRVVLDCGTYFLS